MRSIEALLQTSEDLRAETADMIWIPGGTFRMALDQFYPAEAAVMAILLAVIGANLLGEGIRDALDPRLRQAVGRFARLVR